MVDLKGKRIVMRHPKMKDCDDIVKHIGEKTVNDWLINVPYPYTKKCFMEYIKDNRKKLLAGTDIGLAMHEKEHDEIIGGVGIHHISHEEKHAEIGYWVAKKYWRKGYASEAVKLVLGYCFGRLGLKRVYLKTYSGNVASQSLAAKLGFKKEAVLRKHRKLKGRYHDELWFGMLKNEKD